MNYIQQSDLEAYLGVTFTTAQQETFSLLLPLLQEMIDNYCNRTWNFTNPIIETFDALSAVGATLITNRIFFPKAFISETPADTNYPLMKGIISIVVGTTPLDKNYIVSYKSSIKLSSSFPSIITANPLGFKMIAITYNSDDAGNPPPSVKLAFIQWIGRLMNTASDAGKEVDKTQTGTVQVQFTADAVGGIPDFVKLALDPHRMQPLDHF